MVAPRLGTQSRRLPAPWRAGALSRLWSGETRSRLTNSGTRLQPGAG